MAVFLTVYVTFKVESGIFRGAINNNIVLSYAVLFMFLFLAAKYCGALRI